MRTIYAGLSFEVVKEAETFLGTRGITSSATGEANLTNYNPHGSDHTRGTRYYFIRDGGQELRTDKSGEALPDRTKGVRTYLYLNGERVAVNNLYNTNHGQYYYGSDILGSVKFITGQGGQEVKRIEYDVFGGIYKGNSPYGLETGYTGKPYGAVTGLSDYGFRDYSPTHARFITEDPIRDGENWFSYVGNNPVNWIDPWGLSASEKKKEDTYKVYVGYMPFGGTIKGPNHTFIVIETNGKRRTLIEGYPSNQIKGGASTSSGSSSGSFSGSSSGSSSGGSLGGSSSGSSGTGYGTLINSERTNAETYPGSKLEEIPVPHGTTPKEFVDKLTEAKEKYLSQPARPYALFPSGKQGNCNSLTGSCLRYGGSDYSPGELRAPGWNQEVLDNE